MKPMTFVCRKVTNLQLTPNPCHGLILGQKLCPDGEIYLYVMNSYSKKWTIQYFITVSVKFHCALMQVKSTCFCMIVGYKG